MRFQRLLPRRFGKGALAFTLVEILLAMSLLGLLAATIGPTFSKSSVSTRSGALALAAALKEARQQAITQQVPVALVIPSGNGAEGQADSYYIASGEQPRIARVSLLGTEQPGLRLMVGHWPLDTTKLRDSELTTTVTPPPETTWCTDFDVGRWSLARPKDYAFIYTPRGKLVTNGLPHFDGAYHILVSHGGTSAAASAPGDSGLDAAASPTLFSPTEVGSPYTVSLSPEGAVTVTPGVAGAFDGAAYIKKQALASEVPTPARLDPPPTRSPVVTRVNVLPNPAKLKLPDGVDLLLAPNRHMTITTRAKSPDRVPLFCQWTAIGGGLSSAESLRMTYLPDLDEWESTWQWRAPADASPGDEFTIQGRVHDGQGQETLAYLSSGTDPVIQVGVSDPKVAFVSERDGNYEIYAMNADGTELSRHTDVTSWDRYPVWSPDGNRIAFTAARAGNAEIFVMNSDGSGQTNLTRHFAGDWYASWSPDGGRIAFASNRNGNCEIFVMNADGSGTIRLTNHPAWDERPAWSPLGDRIVFTSDRDGRREIYAMNADGSGQTRLTAVAGWNDYPCWSPDGSRIVFASGRSGNYKLYMMNPDGSGQTQLTTTPAGDHCPSWTPADGGKIAFHSRRDGNYEIYLMNADGSGRLRPASRSIHPKTIIPRFAD